MEEQKQYLIDLDAEVGDGDLGLTMSRGFGQAAEALQISKEEDVGKLLMNAGMTIARTAPSTMGTLIATGFMKGGKAVQGKAEINLSDFTEIMTAFVESIMARGKSKPGEKTIIDSLHPAAEALKQAAAGNKSLAEGMTMALEASSQGVEATKEMIPQHGRIAYYQEKSVGKQDPGATVGMLLIKTFADYICGNH